MYIHVQVRPQRTIVVSGRKSVLLFDHVIRNDQYRHNNVEDCQWRCVTRVAGLKPIEINTDHMSRFRPYWENLFFTPPMEYFRNLFYGVKQDYYRLDSCRRRSF